MRENNGDDDGSKKIISRKRTQRWFLLLILFLWHWKWWALIVRCLDIQCIKWPFAKGASNLYKFSIPHPHPNHINWRSQATFVPVVEIFSVLRFGLEMSDRARTPPYSSNIVFPFYCCDFISIITSLIIIHFYVPKTKKCRSFGSFLLKKKTIFLIENKKKSKSAYSHAFAIHSFIHSACQLYIDGCCCIPNTSISLTNDPLYAFIGLMLYRLEYHHPKYENQRNICTVYTLFDLFFPWQTQSKFMHIKINSSKKAYLFWYKFRILLLIHMQYLIHFLMPYWILSLSKVKIKMMMWKGVNSKKKKGEFSWKGVIQIRCWVKCTRFVLYRHLAANLFILFFSNNNRISKKRCEKEERARKREKERVRVRSSSKSTTESRFSVYLSTFKLCIWIICLFFRGWHNATVSLLLVYYCYYCCWFTLSLCLNVYMLLRSVVVSQYCWQLDDCCVCTFIHWLFVVHSMLFSIDIVDFFQWLVVMPHFLQHL